MRRLTLIFILHSILHLSSPAQPSTYTDPRDGNVYQTIRIGSTTWFRENLRLITPNSYYKTIKDSVRLRTGNYYSHTELDQLCPTGWRIATLDDFEAYFKTLAESHSIPPASIIRSYSTDRDNSTRVVIGTLNPMDDTLLRVAYSGWVEGKKLHLDKAASIWVTDTASRDFKFHAHIGPRGYVIHTHLHNVIDKPRLVRKFGMRCVCDCQ